MDVAARNTVGADSMAGQTRAPGRAMSRLARSFVLLASLSGLAIWGGNAMAATCTSTVAGGNWNAGGTWLAGCGAGGPLAGDTVIIATSGGNAVTVNVATANVLSVTVNAGAILTQNFALNTAGALNVAGTLTSNAAMAITGAATVTGNLTIAAGAVARTFTGLVTVTGGTWNNSGNRAVTFRGGITNNGAFTAGTGTQTFNLTQAIGGANPINFGGIVAVVGAVTVTNNNTNSVTITGNLTGSAVGSTWVNAANSTLNYGGAAAPMGAQTFTASAVPNTVNYNGGAAQAVKTADYNNLTITKAAGIAATTAAGTLNVTGVLSVTSGTLNIAGTTIAVAGATNVSSTLGITSTTGAKTFTGPVTVNAGGVWNNSINESVTFRGGITHNGTTFTAGTGAQTFDTNSQAISGASPINFGGIVAVVGAVTVTNNNTNIVTIAGNLTGSAAGSTWVNAANSTLNYGGAAAPMGAQVFAASAVPNTVNYYRAGAQAVSATTYHHLEFSGTLAKTAAAGLTVNGNLTLSGSATFAAGAFTHNFAGNWVVNTTAAAPLSAATTSIINFNAPAIPAATSMGGTTAATLAFADVNINNSSGVTFNENASFSSGTTPTLTVAAGATLTPAPAAIISGTGALTGSGAVQVTRTAATANFASQYTISTKTLTNLTVEYAGAAAQTVSVLTYGSATGGGLKVNNASGVSLTANTTVAGTLTLASGVISTGAFTLITGKACNAPSVVRAGGHVAGFLQKNIPVGAPVNCTFEVGDAANYRPIDTVFASVTTAGNLAGSVSQVAGEHPNIATSGIDSAKDVNRYWTITNPGGIVFTTYSATFNFINPADFDAGAAPANFEVEFWNGAWNSSPLGTRTLGSTQASGIAAFGNFAVGEKKPITLGNFNAFETATAAGAIAGVIKTKIAGSAFALDVVAISGGAQFAGFSNAVKVELLGNTVTGVALDAQNCPVSFTLLQTVSPDPTITAGRSTVSFAAVANAWKDVRVRISYLTADPAVIACSADNFAIRPGSLSVIATDTDWQTAGTSRALNNSGAAGGNVHKAGRPFTIQAAAYNAAAVITGNYAGSPAIQTLACTQPAPACTNGTLTPGAWTAAGGTVTSTTATYSEAGSFNLILQDTTFASVDAADTPATCAGYYVCSAAVSAGRFVPDHFVITANNVPRFNTSGNAACAVRSFTYIGQPFGYATAPQVLVTAQNSANATTRNYTRNLWKLAAAAGAKDCTTNPDICTLTSGSVTQTYTYTTSNGPLPNWDSTQVVLATPTIIADDDGTGTVTSASGDLLAFKRSATPLVRLNTNIMLRSR